LYADEHTTLLYNTIKIINTFSSGISVDVGLFAPLGWNVVSIEKTYLDIAPGETQSIPVTLLKQHNATANWLEAKIAIHLKNSADTSFFPFYLKAQPVKNFRAIPFSQRIQLGPGEKTVIIPLKIKNSGNTEGHYNIEYSISFMELKHNIKLALAAKKDTVVTYKVSVPESYLRTLRSELININIKEEEGMIHSYAYILERVSSNASLNKHAYPTIPIVFEGGILSFDNAVTYYGAVSSSITFDSVTNLSLYYRSKDYGDNSIAKNVYYFSFNHKRWHIYFGQIRDVIQFLTFGNGIKTVYDLHKGSVSIYANKSRELYINNDNAGVSFKYNGWKNKVMTNDLLANVDHKTNVNSIIQSNSIKYKNKAKQLAAGISFAFGLENHTNPAIHDNNTLWGYEIGYDLSYFHKKSWAVTSTVQFNSNSFPGLYKGYRMQSHDLKWMLNKSLFVDAFYTSNYTKQSFFRDSIFYYNKLLMNMTRYGIRSGVTFKRMNFVLGYGKASYTSASTNSLPQYDFASGDLTINLGSYSQFFFSTMGGYKSDYGKYKTNILFYTNTGGVSFKFGGVQMLYNNLPLFQDPSDPSIFTGYQTTMYLSPYLNAELLKRKLRARIQYNYSTLSPGDIINQAVSGSISYANIKRGINLQLSGSMPLGNSVLKQYAILSLEKKFGVPVITSRKFYNLNITLFNDANNNGKRDADETLLKNVRVYINNTPFVTDGKGCIQYKNIPKDKYVIDFTNTNSIKGIIPANGNTQNIIVTANTKVDIPFKKGKVINGSIIVKIDSFSNQRFDPDRLKVTAVDSSGMKYSTLTDAKGNFFINVPAGHYLVSLNPAAFDDVFKPSQIAYTVDLSYSESATVVFEIQQRKRKVNIIKANLK
jgi:hypothetical protein